MPVRYSIHRNCMSGGEERYRAVVESVRTVDFDGRLARALFKQSDLRADHLGQKLTIST